MRKLTVFIEGSHKTLYLDENISVVSKSTMILKNVAIYWHYKNVLTGVNDIIYYGTDSSVSNRSQKITFGEGYWSFDMIKEKLRKYGVTLTRVTHNNKCQIYSKSHVLDLSKFGPLLGFPVNQMITDGVNSPNVITTSSSAVDVNQGLRYVTISCDAVNTALNTNTDGERSFTLATLPITSDQHLNGTVTFFGNIESRASINDGCYNKFTFNISTNITNKVDTSMLLELYVA